MSGFSVGKNTFDDGVGMEAYTCDNSGAMVNNSEIFIFAGLVRLFKAGTELVFGSNVRVAPLGNRTGQHTGKYPHYHRRPQPGVNGLGTRRQGIGRHRPWDSKSGDKSFWDRF